jgi:hypothetical protein
MRHDISTDRRALLKKSAKEGHREFQSERSLTKEQLRARVRKPVSQWSAYELGALLASLIEDVDQIEYDVFCSMAEGSDCFFADSAIDWEKYEAAAEKLRRSKAADGEKKMGAPLSCGRSRAQFDSLYGLARRGTRASDYRSPRSKRSTRWLPEASRLIPEMRSPGWPDSVISRLQAGSWTTAVIASYKSDTGTRYRSRCTWRGASGRLPTGLEMRRPFRRKRHGISSGYSREAVPVGNPIRLAGETESRNASVL